MSYRGIPSWLIRNMEKSPAFANAIHNSCVFVKAYCNIDKAFELFAKNIVNATRDEINNALKKATTSLINYAIIKSNPNAGSHSMLAGNRNRLLYRPIVNLKLLCAGKINGFNVNIEDIDALKNGYVYKVVKSNDKNQKAFAYTRTLGEAKQAAYIRTRGLLRYAWGANMEAAGMKIPRSLKSLVKENPYLTEYRSMNQVFLDDTQNGSQITIINSAPVKKSYKEAIGNIVYKYFNRTLDKQIKNIMVNNLKKEIENANKNLNDALENLGINSYSARNNLFNDLWNNTILNKFPRLSYLDDGTLTIKDLDSGFTGTIISRNL